jgi:hypothetical protein
MNQASISSTDQGSGKRRTGNSMLLPVDHAEHQLQVLRGRRSPASL